MNINKSERLLAIYVRLLEGEVINKYSDAKYYHVNERTIIRDIKDIRTFFKKKLVDDGYVNEVIFDRKQDGYRLEKTKIPNLSSSQVLIISKILLESRAFSKLELIPMLEQLIDSSLNNQEKRLVADLIANEKFHYVEPKHGIILGETIWKLGHAIKKTNYVTVTYQRVDSSIVNRRLQPLAILFSEYYFYLVAYIHNEEQEMNHQQSFDSTPTIYRIDRIQHMTIHKEQFKVPYRDRFEEGEFRKRIQFMYGGALQRVKFKFTGHSIEAVLDRLPTAKIITQQEKEYIMEAEVYGNGIDMWLRSQGDCVERID